MRLRWSSEADSVHPCHEIQSPGLANAGVWTAQEATTGAGQKLLGLLQ